MDASINPHPKGNVASESLTKNSEVDGEWALRAETADFISGALLQPQMWS